MTTNEDILKAMAAEKHKIMSSTIKPQMKPNITDAEIKDLLLGINVNKAHGPDDISAQMIQLCGTSLILPLKIIFSNIIHTGIFPAS